MLVLGLILILLSAGSLLAVLSSGADDQAALYGGSVELPTLVVFLGGAAALLVFIMGLELVRSGIRRANENRRTKKKLRRLEKRDGLRRDEDVPATSGTADPGTATTRRTDGEPTTDPGTTGVP